QAERAVDERSEQWVALERDQVVGVAGFHPAWWTGDAGVHSIEIRVAPDHSRQGIGSLLYDRLWSRLLRLGATRLVGWVRADAAGGRGFAARHGFQESGEVIQEYRLAIG